MGEVYRARDPTLARDSALKILPGALATDPLHVDPEPGRSRPPSRLQLIDDVRPEAVREIAAALPARAWRRVTWRNGTNRPWTAHFAALRVTPAHDWRTHRLAPEVWVLFERDLGSTPRSKAYLVDLPATASLPSWSAWRITAGQSDNSSKN